MKMHEFRSPNVRDGTIPGPQALVRHDYMDISDIVSYIRTAIYDQHFIMNIKFNGYHVSNFKVLILYGYNI